MTFNNYSKNFFSIDRKIITLTATKLITTTKTNIQGLKFSNISLTEHLLARAEEGIDLDKTIGKLFCFYTIIIRNCQTKLFIIDRLESHNCMISLNVYNQFSYIMARCCNDFGPSLKAKRRKVVVEVINWKCQVARKISLFGLQLSHQEIS